MPAAPSPAAPRGPAFAIDARTFFTSQRPSREMRAAQGADHRATAPLSALAEVPDAAQRRDPIALLHSQDADRQQDLVPLRYERMAASPFAFLRGAAIVMASDLSMSGTSGINVQLCGDAHVSNFGLFASAERNLVFDVNDFDETLPGPFDWDVRRLAASAAVAAQAAGASDKKARKAALTSAMVYRQVMAFLADRPRMDVWNLRVDADYLVNHLGTSKLRDLTRQAIRQSRSSSSATAANKLTQIVDGQRRFRNEPPLLMTVPEDERDSTIDLVAPAYELYLQTLPADRVALLAHFSFEDIARKVVGVGSVGTIALVMLLKSGDGEPLVLQIKQASASVLEEYLGASTFDNHGQRVVVGQRVLQTSGDPFLGWIGHDSRLGKHAFYIRQLKDMKGSIEVDSLGLAALTDYAAVCAATLARAHARVGDAAAISGYLGTTPEFDEAIADFAMSYAAVTVADHAALCEGLAQTGASATADTPADASTKSKAKGPSKAKSKKK